MVLKRSEVESFVGLDRQKYMLDRSMNKLKLSWIHFDWPNKLTVEQVVQYMQSRLASVCRTGRESDQGRMEI